MILWPEVLKLGQVTPETPEEFENQILYFGTTSVGVTACEISSYTNAYQVEEKIRKSKVQFFHARHFG